MPCPVSQNLDTVHDIIRSSATAAGRSADSINLVAVSKKQPVQRIQAAIDAGHRVFGENRVQEAYAHWHDVKIHYPDLRLHLIGPLQTNKVKEAVRLFDVIETLDREKLAKALSKEMMKQNRNLPCFIQVNTGEEQQKSGVLPQDLEQFISFCRDECELDIKGLMCIPPVDDPPGLHFGLLLKMAKLYDLEDLSMGMSDDFRMAIAMGATHVRLGTSVFGARM